MRVAVLVIGSAAALGSCAIVALFLFGIARSAPYAEYSNRSAPPPIPSYPSGRRLIDQSMGSVTLVRALTFDTTDSPSAVYRFYDEQLPLQEANGWRPYDDLTSYAAPRVYAAIGCTTSFFLTLDAIEDGAGTTRVMLQLMRSGWCM